MLRRHLESNPGVGVAIASLNLPIFFLFSTPDKKPRPKLVASLC